MDGNPTSKQLDGVEDLASSSVTNPCCCWFRASLLHRA